MMFKEKLRNKSNHYNLFVFFIMWPFGAFIYAICNYRKFKYHWIILLFCMLYGYTAVTTSINSDISRYNVAFSIWADSNLDNYIDIIKKIIWNSNYIPDRYLQFYEQKDFYANTALYVVSRFTDNSRYFFAFIALVYFYLYIVFYRDLLKNSQWNNSYSQLFFFIFSMLIVPFDVGISGIRFWTALYVYLICLQKFINNPKPKYIIASSLSMLVHFSFAFPVLIFFILSILRFNKSFLKIITFISVLYYISPSSNLFVENLKNIFVSLGAFDSISGKVDVYTSIDNLEDANELIMAGNWYFILYQNLFMNFTVLVFLFEFFKLIRLEDRYLKIHFVSSYYLFFIIALITSDLGSIGRFKIIFYIFFLIRLFLLASVSSNDKTLKFLTVLFFVPFFLHVLISFRSGLYTVDPYLLMGNLVSIFILRSDVSLSVLLIGH